MRRAGVQRASTRRTSRGRVVAAALALGAVSALAFAPSAGAAPSSGTATEISSAKSSKFGTILVSEETVYTLKPSKTACTAACQKVWIPVLLPEGTTSATAGTGVDASKLGTVAAGTAMQVTYGGKALYWFAKDTAPGQVKGKVTTKWGKWSPVVVKAKSGGSGGSAGTGGSSF
jgi:predicted lipoprotein with Yx(FWY)xxD motif